MLNRILEGRGTRTHPFEVVGGSNINIVMTHICTGIVLGTFGVERAYFQHGRKLFVIAYGFKDKKRLANFNLDELAIHESRYINILGSKYSIVRVK